MHTQIRKIVSVFVIFHIAMSTSSTLLSSELEEDDEDPLPRLELPPYVVVATRTLLSLDQVSPSVSYVPAEEMLRHQDNRLVDVLSRQPGMVLNTSGAKGGQVSLFTRGTNSDHTGFFIDGRRLNPGFFNSYNLEFLPVDNLNSIEVQRGASSVNFGSSGIGGVVSLQTRSSLGSKTRSTTVEAEYGSYDTYRSAVNASFSDEAWALSLGSSVFSTDNKRDNDDFESLNFNGRFEYKLSEHFIFELLSFATQSDKEVSGPITSPSPTDEGETESLLVSPGLRYQNGNWSGRIFYSKNKLTFDNRSLETGFNAPFPTELTDSGSTVKTDELYGQLNYESPIDVLFSLGVLYRNDRISNSNIDFFDPSSPARPFYEHLEQVGLWSQVQWQLTETFEVRLGGRVDEYTDFKSSANGSVEALYTFSNLGVTLFAKLANSYAPPSASDLAFDINLQNSVIVDTPLEPEEGESYEVGAQYAGLNDTVTGSVVLFRNEIENLIGFAYEQLDFSDPSTIITNDSFNINHATTEGIEFTIGYNPVESIYLSCAYTYLVAIDDDRDERLLRRPRHILQLSADYEITDALFLGIQGLGYFDRKDIDGFSTVDHEDYFVINLLTDYELNECVTLFARIENLLDENYESVLGYPALGRTGYMGARLSF